ncbi:zinc ribbon domain-containing protein, partial [Actinoplanes sp. NPDC051633]|uniref:zinc ribbon domain-containing protein n=1 Tax=Actinoplanes sp. NPDC051633 TaxID=3155670 RepID=UPI00341C2B7E
PKTIEAKRNRSFLKSISVMETEAGREVERKKARATRDAELAARREELDQALRLTGAKGYLLRPEANAFWADYEDVLSSDAGLRGRLERADIREVETRPTPTPTIDTNHETVLRSYLQAVQAPTLYVLLREVDKNLTERSPLEQLQQAVKLLGEKADRTIDKSRPEVTAWDRLATVGRALFGTDDGRARYDQFVELQALELLLKRLEKFLGAAQAITAEQVELFLKDARTAGVRDLDMARDRLVGHFRTKLWVVDLPDREAVSRVAVQIQCPYCAALNPPGSRICSTCEFKLDEPCPSCGQIDPQYGGCRCGFPLGHRPRVQEFLADARRALDEHDFHRADLVLGHAEEIWRLPVERADAIATEMQRIRGGIDLLRQDLKSIARRIDDLMRTRRFVAAEQQLRQAPLGLPRRELLLAEAEKAVREARRRCREARQPGVGRERRIELYSEALRICDDLEAARSELADIPPAPPTGVRAVVDDPAAGVLITWDPSPDGDVTYLVMRGTGTSAPHSAERLPTQHRLGPATKTSLRDRDAAAMPGMVLRYAVLADRYGTYSPVVAAAPVVVTAEATVTPDNSDAGVIRLDWQLPERAVDVRITRIRIGGGGDPVPLRPTEPGRLFDTDVDEGSRYRYTVRVGYEDPGGGLCYSRGVVAEISATRPPAAPDRLSAVGVPSEFSFSPHRVQLRWPAPGAGRIEVVRQAGAGTLREGDRCNPADIKRAGYVLTGPSPLIDRWIERAMEVCTYAPVLVVDGMAYVGKPRHYANAAEVTEPTVEFSGRLMRVGWTWPADSAGVAIGYDSAAMPDDPTVAAHQLVVYRNGPDPSGECNLPIGSKLRTHVRIGTVIRRGNAEFITAGVGRLVERPQLTVQYSVRDVRRQSELVLEVAESARVPALVLRGRVGGPPRSRDDGEVVRRLEPMRIAGRHVERLGRQSGDLQYRLFTASADDGGAVSLEHR